MFATVDFRDTVYARLGQAVERETPHATTATMMGLGGLGGESVGAVGMPGAAQDKRECRPGFLYPPFFP